MANADHVATIREGVDCWNSWRSKNSARPDFSKTNLHGINLWGADLAKSDFREANLGKANLSTANLSGANFWGAYLNDIDLSHANLRKANFSKAILAGANLSGADLSHGHLIGADLFVANLTGADLHGANLSRAFLTQSNFSSADLTGANLTGSVLLKTVLNGADFVGCRIYGISAWDVELEGAIQSDLIITPENAPTITVDSLEVAQFIYLLLNNEKIRHVIDTITSKVVLILGRFTPERKVILDAIRDELRKRDYLPVLFDFEKPSNRDITETVSTLAHMARFVIADITDAKSIPQELMKIVPALPSVPVRPILLASEHEWGMFRDLTRYPWVLKPYLYTDQAALLGAIESEVIVPEEAKAKQQTGR